MTYRGFSNDLFPLGLTYQEGVIVTGTRSVVISGVALVSNINQDKMSIQTLICLINQYIYKT